MRPRGFSELHQDSRFGTGATTLMFNSNILYDSKGVQMKLSRITIIFGKANRILLLIAIFSVATVAVAFGGNMPKAGDKAPNFSLPDQAGKVHKLADYRGKKVVLYFYPKDDTPGCTKEACSFRDSFADFKKAGIEVLGVSVDDESSHTKFAEKYNLPFTLLADKDKKIVEKYGVWGEKNMYGKTFMGTNRVTFLIDGDGKIVKVFDKVKPDEHAKEVLEAFAK
jgi:thioredoxin-dependent peroxiredoxin